MLAKSEDCRGCALYNVGKGFSRPDGSGRLGIVGIGESLGSEEVWDGLPFRPKAQAGSKLEEILALAGVDRQDLLLWNVVACQPPGNKLGGWDNAIQHCKVHFDRVLGTCKESNNIGRTVVIAFGSVPTHTLGGSDITKVRGFVLEARRQTPTEGLPIIQEYGLMVPTFHPSFIKRGNPELTPLAAMDVQRALAVARGEFTNYPSHPSFRDFNINKFPSLEDGWSFYNLCRDNQRLINCLDIETPRSRWTPEDERDTILEDKIIIQIQFSINDRSAIVFPWKEPYLDVIRAILGLENVKANHFLYGFDLPRIEAQGAKVNGKLHDTMWMFKHWHPRLPRNLQNVASICGFPYPWKHLADADPQWYGGCDTIAVQYELRYLPEKMKRLGVWEGYMDSIVREHIILQGAARRGIPINEEKRQALKIQLKLERKIKDKELQGLIPDKIKNILPRRSQGKDERGEEIWDYGYKKEPKKLLDIAADNYNRFREQNDQGNADISFQDYLERVAIFKTAPRKDGKQDAFRLLKRKFSFSTEKAGEVVEVERWVKVMVFKPSKEGLVRYIEWKREELENG
jgi:uracil-DNA glycosylase family 4